MDYLCDFWKWEKVALAKFCISQIFGLCNFFAIYFITVIFWLMHFLASLLHRPAVPGGALDAMAPPAFGGSINPISTKRGSMLTK